MAKKVHPSLKESIIGGFCTWPAGVFALIVYQWLHFCSGNSDISELKIGEFPLQSIASDADKGRVFGVGVRGRPSFDAQTKHSH